MRKRDFGSLGPVSALTLGGGGIGQVWGPTTREESVATVVEAVESACPPNAGWAARTPPR